MKYNNNQSALAMPEYGRNVQNMVDYCLSLEDREQRNHCARTIIRTMHDISPERRTITQSDKVYWDHLAIMSDFKLDIDFPEGTITEEQAKSKPCKMEYNIHNIKYRFYGNIVQQLVEKACEMEDCPERIELAKYIAAQMKRSYIIWNKNTVDDVVIFRDLFDLSDGKLLLSPVDCVLPTEAKATEGNKPTNKKRLRFKRKG
ncbi:DUF4290 domain-containing protein [Porphyromonas macacae]|uniref:DUF4290 domain-containing protein n=1 Tax=Porphyromonas macacae TaxID=28115 RepID=UPI0035A13B27